MAATASKPQLSSIQTKSIKTPISATSATYPSEMRSPMPGTPSFAKTDFKFEPIKTPITPPTAYLDFLQRVSPTLMTPPASCPLVSSLYKPSLVSTASTESVCTTASSASMTSTADARSDISRPETPSTSVTVDSSCTRDFPKATSRADVPAGPRTAPLPSHFKRPPPKGPRITIPKSPCSPASVRSPLGSATSATSTSIYSPLSASMSPRERDMDKGPNSARAVKVRHTITRTVTYARPITPIVEPVPANKKRKMDTPS